MKRSSRICVQQGGSFSFFIFLFTLSVWAFAFTCNKTKRWERMMVWEPSIVCVCVCRERVFTWTHCSPTALEQLVCKSLYFLWLVVVLIFLLYLQNKQRSGPFWEFMWVQCMCAHKDNDFGDVCMRWDRKIVCVFVYFDLCFNRNSLRKAIEELQVINNVGNDFTRDAIPKILKLTDKIDIWKESRNVGQRLNILQSI